MNFATSSSDIEGTEALTVTGKLTLEDVEIDSSIISLISGPIVHINSTSPVDLL